MFFHQDKNISNEVNGTNYNAHSFFFLCFCFLNEFENFFYS